MLGQDQAMFFSPKDHVMVVIRVWVYIISPEISLSLVKKIKLNGSHLQSLLAHVTFGIPRSHEGGDNSHIRKEAARR